MPALEQYNPWKFNWHKKTQYIPSLHEYDDYPNEEDRIVHKIKTLISDIGNNETETNLGITASPEIPFTSHSTISTSTSIVTESSTMLADLVTETSASIDSVTTPIIDFIQNVTGNSESTVDLDASGNSSVITTTLGAIDAQNGTFFQETTPFTLLDVQNSSIIEETTPNLIEASSNRASFETVTETIQSAFTSMQETTRNLLSSTTESTRDLHEHHEHHVYEHEHGDSSPVLLLVILGVILAILIIVIVILIFIYKRYKKHNGIGARSGEYYVTHVNTSSSCNDPPPPCYKAPSAPFVEVDIYQEKL